MTNVDYYRIVVHFMLVWKLAPNNNTEGMKLI